MAKRPSRQKLKGRKESGTFTAIPHAVQDSQNWCRCGKNARALLTDIARQYNGKNNGDLCAAVTTMKAYGWKRGETLSNLLRELRHYGLLEMTRQGGLNRPSLYALTWQPIDECNGKLDCLPRHTASGEWKRTREKYQRQTHKKSKRHAA